MLTHHKNRLFYIAMCNIWSITCETETIFAKRFVKSTKKCTCFKRSGVAGFCWEWPIIIIIIGVLSFIIEVCNGEQNILSRNVAHQ